MYYHGSSVGNLDQLHPNRSEHGRPYVYFSSNPVVAAFYTVHCVERPYQWFPYGFSVDGIPIYTEYYPDALRDVYGGRSGYLYQRLTLPGLHNPTDICCACVCDLPIAVQPPTAIDDMYLWFLACEQKGTLQVNRFASLTVQQLDFRFSMVRDEIQKYDLLSNSKCDYAKFLAARFPDIWPVGCAVQHD